MSAEASTPARRRWRAVDGIVLLDKPRGLSSTQALQRVRRHLQAEKAGHAGTLDPLATGMLPLCFGQATKACGTLLGRRKAYAATLRLGVATDTGDAEGREIEARPVAEFDEDTLERVLDALRGERLQLPPMYSALKREGRPLYELARRGVTVEREPRHIRIERLAAARSGSADLSIEVVCSKGTYVRVLGEEIAAGLGTVGHLKALRRLWVEPFDASQMVTLEQVEATPATVRAPDWLLSVDCAFPDLPVVELDATQALHLRQGRALVAPRAAGEAGSLVRAYAAGGGLLGLVEVGADGLLRVHRLFVPGAGTG